MRNTSAKFGKRYLLAIIGLLPLIARPAYAVVGNVSLVSAGEPVAQATISLQTMDGQVVAEGETDDDGKAAIFIPDNHKGRTLILIASKGDRTARQRVDIDRDELRIALSLPEVEVAGTRSGLEFSVGVAGLYKWANFDGSHDLVSADRSESGDLDSSGVGVGVDMQLGHSSWNLWGRPFFFALGFGLPSNMDKEGVRADYHPPEGFDTSLSVEENWYLRLMLAYEIAAIRQLHFTFFAGAQFTDVDVAFTTDETGGEGIVNRFADSQTMTGPVLGLGVSHPIDNVPADVYAAFYLAWMDDIRGDGRSSLGNLYRYNVDGGIQSEIQVGVRLLFK
jgi:hypothetical protein